MSTTENENQAELLQAGNELDPPQQHDDNDLSAELAAADLPVETAADDDPDAPADNDEPEVLPGGDSPRLMNETGDSQADEFVGLDDTDLEDPALGSAKATPVAGKADNSEGKAVADNSEKVALADNDESAGSKENSLHKQTAQATAKGSESDKRAAGWSLANKLASIALVAVIAAAFYLYHNPSLIGFTKARPPETPAAVQTVEVAPPIQQPVVTPKVPSKGDTCIAKVEEALRLRNDLLEKNQEIYELDVHYRNGIAELEAEIRHELKQLGSTTFDKAMKNKRIELKLRTIQRRKAYIHGLIKPAYWLNKGSEELFYLARRAQLDLQMTEIADGIDLNKHTRHINAAIQRYLPSTEKLAVDPEKSELQPLEQIWQQVRRKKNTAAKNKQIGLLALNPTDKLIINQACSGNFERITELTNITSRGARCLSQMKGTELILSSLAAVSADAAQQLFQWQGNWLCLNGIKKLSPAAARSLFKWKGNWISLNSLADFPPELAKQLLKWEGRQIELMGLEPKKSAAGQKTLKYLALWETTGGKLFVTDQMRQAMKKLM
ncbi:hypothetical protein D1AOALGA4SA_1929 [Olavius algarvensis Delta 1 endosymbiont]|nr:hypothetical protein D1AOALGA4SA_1929 [Olavius algarvensis Delta 1 endosymbiont]